jgi:hypothetical protein
MSDVLPSIVYTLCALTSLVCTLLLWRDYARTRQRFLFLVAACFAGLTLHNLLLFVDLVLVPSLDFVLLRSAVGLAAMASLLVVLIWEAS